MACLGARIRKLVSRVLFGSNELCWADEIEGMTAFAEKKKPEWSHE